MIKSICAPMDYKGGQLSFEKPLLMGILNMTPDSFYDGGKYFDSDVAYRHALQLVADGADIIDIGGASSRPGSTPIAAEEELQRVLSLIRDVTPRLGVPISVDSDKAEVMEAALEAGAVIINDIGGLQRDPAMAGLAASYSAPVVVMHSGIAGTYTDIIDDMLAFFHKSIEIGLSAGMKDNQFIIDPGVGFGKNTKENLEVLRRLSELRVLGRPILLAASNKRFIRETLARWTGKLLVSNAAVTSLGVAAGADIIRVHDVAAMAEASRLTAAILSE